MHRSAFASVLVLILLFAIGCAQPAEEVPAEPPAERVENAGLGVAVAALPAFFKVASNDGVVIELAPQDAAVEGKLTISATEPETSGVNLVAAIEAHKADIESREAGSYKGQRELGSQLGTAFYSRGQWSDGGRTMEETSIFLIHPLGDRQLVLNYVYPAGDDSSERLMDQLFAVLGEVEGLAPAAPEAATDGSSADEATAEQATPEESAG